MLSRDSLLDLTQGRNTGSFERSIDVLVSRIRRKIEPNPQDPTMIKTVRSGGYLFTPRTEAVDERPLKQLSRGVAAHEAVSGSSTSRASAGRSPRWCVASIVALHLVVTAAFLISRPDRAGRRRRTARRNWPMPRCCSARHRASERPRLLADLARAFPKLDIETHRARHVPSVAAESEGQHLHGMRRHLGRGYRVVQLASADGGPHRIGVELARRHRDRGPGRRTAARRGSGARRG